MFFFPKILPQLLPFRLWGPHTRQVSVQTRGRPSLQVFFCSWFPEAGPTPGQAHVLPPSPVIGSCPRRPSSVGKTGWLEIHGGGSPTGPLDSPVCDDLTSPGTPSPGTSRPAGCTSCGRHLKHKPVRPPTFDLEQTVTHRDALRLQKDKQIPERRVAWCEQWAWQSPRGSPEGPAAAVRSPAARRRSRRAVGMRDADPGPTARGGVHFHAARRAAGWSHAQTGSMFP